MSYVVGSYVGNGVENREINVGFYPSCVIVCASFLSGYAKMATRDVSSTGMMQISQNGFIVTGDMYVNSSGSNYNYVAFA